MEALLQGSSLAGQTVMDLGCGLGGDTLLLGGEYNAGRVYSVDVDEGNLARTREAVEQAGLSKTVYLTLVEPGPLPFDEAMFDLVHSKAMMCHLPPEDLESLFSEIHRILKPGGGLAAADWMVGDMEALSRAYHDFANDLANTGLVFYFKSAKAHRQALEHTGFVNISLEDVSKQVAHLAREILENVLGPLQQTLRETLGDQGYDGMVSRNRGRADALASGDLQFQYLKAKKP